MTLPGPAGRRSAFSIKPRVIFATVGSTRALHALLHGHWLDSLRYNVPLVPTLIWLGTLFSSGTRPYSEGADRRRGRTCPVYRGAQYSAVVTAAFSGFRLLRACRNNRVRHGTLKISSQYCPTL
ncbi:MAG: DUF2752 domain-containing protein [Akkermansia sp.]